MTDLADPDYLVVSLHTGALLCLITAAAYDGWVHGSRPSKGASLYVLLSLLTSTLGSGWLEMTLAMPPGSVGSQVAAWAFVFFLLLTAMAGISGSRRWLGFPWRGANLDRYMRAIWRSLLVALAFVVVAAAMAWLHEPASRALEPITRLAGVMAVVALLVCAFVCYRMAQLSDRLSLWLTWATVLTAPGIALLAIHRSGQGDIPTWLWAALATAHAVAMLCTAYAAVQQDQLNNARQRADTDAANLDALGRVALGERLSHEFTPKFDRLHERGVAPAILVINVFNHDEIMARQGVAAADQVSMATLNRLRAVLNPHDVMARYFDACFVVLIRAQVDTHYLREVCLRVATSVRRDVALRGLVALENDHAPIALDVGVGLCWSDRIAQFSDALDQAGTAAAAARGEACKASVVLYPGKPAVSVEAVLGGPQRASPHAGF